LISFLFWEQIERIHQPFHSIILIREILFNIFFHNSLTYINKAYNHKFDKILVVFHISLQNTRNENNNKATHSNIKSKLNQNFKLIIYINKLL